MINQDFGRWRGRPPVAEPDPPGPVQLPDRNRRYQLPGTPLAAARSPRQKGPLTDHMLIFIKPPCRVPMVVNNLEDGRTKTLKIDKDAGSTIDIRDLPGSTDLQVGTGAGAPM